MTKPIEHGSANRLAYDLANALALAWSSIRAHKLRSFLTLLGIIIGVGSVILVGSAIEGLGAYAEASTAKAFGSDSVRRNRHIRCVIHNCRHPEYSPR